MHSGVHNVNKAHGWEEACKVRGRVAGGTSQALERDGAAAAACSSAGLCARHTVCGLADEKGRAAVQVSFEWRKRCRRGFQGSRMSS